MQLTNPFEVEGRWYKANLHCHTTVSDGDTSPEERVREYREAGYDVLALTDHERTNDVKKLSSRNFLVISGMETHPPAPFGGDLYHLVCLNVPYNFTLGQHLDAETQIAMVRHAGGQVIYGHPYWSGHNLNHIIALSGYVAVEVYNATSSKIGKPISAVQWDALLDAGRFIGAVAVDDTHRGRDKFMGYTMIKAKTLTADAVMKAIEQGAYYASTGPVFKDVRMKGAKVLVECSPVKEIHFISKRAHGLSLYSDGGEPLTSAQCQFKDLLQYVRVEIVDNDGHRAWTNPMILH
jgi:hypothetical protein